MKNLIISLVCGIIAFAVTLSGFAVSTVWLYPPVTPDAADGLSIIAPISSTIIGCIASLVAYDKWA